MRQRHLYGQTADAVGMTGVRELNVIDAIVASKSGARRALKQLWRRAVRLPSQF